jgi:S-formylglutathione hydrolase FrmB
MKFLRTFNIFIMTVFLFTGTVIFAAQKELVSVSSKCMNKSIPAIVILPESYKNSLNQFPVVYLLHGGGDDESTWVDRTTVMELSDQYNIIVVCPSAGKTSWYFDSPVDPEYQYETFVYSELVSFIDAKYRTVKNRDGRGIAGNSMGGHGSMFLSIRHKDVFGAAAPMSGGMDIRPFSDRWDIKKRLGSIKDHPERWDALTVINLAETLSDGDIVISIDCGTDDFFIGVNRALHEKLLSKRISHDYTERIGGHNWNYWEKSLKYQMIFFSKYFSRVLKK